MASDRRNDLSELVRLVTSIELYTIAPATRGDTTIATTPVAAGASALTVASITNFSNNDPILLIGQGGEADLLQISTTPASGTLTSGYKSAIDAPVGSRVVEMSKVDLGHLDESAITLTGSGDIVDIKASTSKLPLASYFSGGQLGGAANLRGFNMANLQAAFAVAENVQGTGTTNDPYTGVISGLKMGTMTNAVIRGKGTMVDGVSTFWIDWVQATVAPSVNTQIGGTNPVALGLTWRATAVVPRFFK